MKIDIQTFSDFSDYTRYTFYETWFNDKIVIVMGKNDGRGLASYDFSIVTKTINGSPKTSGPRISTNLGNALTSTNNSPSRRISTNLENVETSTNSYRAKTVVDRLELPTQVKKVLFKCDYEEIPLSENQMGSFSDLETLECFWDKVKKKNFK